MRKSIVFTLAGVLIFTCGIFGRELFFGHKHFHPFAQANEMYGKSPSTGICKRLIVCSNCMALEFQKGISGGQANVIDVTGNTYTLWEDATCSTTQVKMAAY
ncbi:hypothetical protein WJU16_03095 [Chitinophaga pollutisoli]|uniref:Uncharacterized protein n=1 Tax=Chitinophaga pollutisoli TaxID=3133966 RepID=A0ABZ2YRR7_9BACT